MSVRSVILDGVWAFDTTQDRRTPGAGLFAPLNGTAYVAWLAAAASGLLVHSSGPPLLPIQWVLALTALMLFLVAFAVRALLEERNASDGVLGSTIILQATLAPVSLWMMNDHLQAVLLVLTAAQLAALRHRRLALAALTLANCALFVWLVRTQSPVKAIQLSFAYLAFELFAAFVSRAAYAAQESRRDVQRTNRELQAARALVAEGVRAQERLRLSRELHDIAGHKLTALKLHLALAVRTLGNEDTGGGLPPAGGLSHARGLSQCLTLADELLTDIRAVVSAFRQEDTIDLRTALRALDPDLSSVSVKFSLEPRAVVSEIGKAEALLRCAQEGLTNALRHGAATEVLVTLSRSEAELVLSVEDNGVGYQSKTPPMGNGLRGLRERLEEFQGGVSLDRRVPRGCILRAVLPEPPLTC